ncbi:MAG: phosphoglucosamine mutase [Desulfobacterales bacterium]|nr:phosphoglucosamine mutase [Desulfobacterales bacterium]
MGSFFGTDGIRGRANVFPMDCETAVKVGRAIVRELGGESSGRDVIIAQDTRLSGDMLAHALAAGVCSAGGRVQMAGVLPTPAAAVLAAAGNACAAVVISASHNPYEDNGIKVFGGDGFKLSDLTEAAIEGRMTGDDLSKGRDPISTIGNVSPLGDAGPRYLDFLLSGVSQSLRLDGVKIVLDCANGAAWQVGPALFSRLGAELTVLSASPDGRNINDGCGSEHPQRLSNAVGNAGAQIGIALDGDADRLIVVDEMGHVQTGDQIIAVMANDMKKNGLLRNNRVITTVMSNMGLGNALAKLGIEHEVAAVGDRHVMARMRETGAVLGGEDSGHLIFMDHHTTGDGIYAALRLVGVLLAENRPLSELSRVMQVYPQELMAIPVRKKPPLDQIPEIGRAIALIEGELKGEGRVLVRYSGTQSVCRVMVEGPDREYTRACCRRIASAVQRSLGRRTPVFP